jgi:hypothetical protein
MIKFPYQKEESKLFGEIYRPLAEFEVKTDIGWVPVLAYVDSGADVSLLPRSFMKVLDIRLEEEEIKEIRGIGEGRVPMIVKTLEVRFGEKTFNAKVAIALVEDVPYILGREDMFDEFRVCFDQNHKVVSFE